MKKSMAYDSEVLRCTCSTVVQSCLKINILVHDETGYAMQQKWRHEDSYTRRWGI